MLAAQVCMLERLVHVLGRNQISAISQVLSHLASSCDVRANASPATFHVATMVSQAKLERRERRAQTGSEATGPKVSTAAPWPWIDVNRPYILPRFIEAGKPKADIPSAVSQLKALVQQTKVSPIGKGEAGRHKDLSRDADSIELNFTFNIDARHPDQIVRGTVVLPHGSGKKQRIAVFAKGAAAEKAKTLGVDVIGDEALINQIVATEGEAINFDRLIATPDFNKLLVKAGRILGPKKLMPNAKAGTLTEDIETAVKLMQAGQIEYRVGRDKQLQLVVGKAWFTHTKLQENIVALLNSLVNARPKAIPGSGLQGYITRMYLKASHTPVIPIDPNKCDRLLDVRQPETPGQGAAAAQQEAPKRDSKAKEDAAATTATGSVAAPAAATATDATTATDGDTASAATTAADGDGVAPKKQ